MKQRQREKTPFFGSCCKNLILLSPGLGIGVWSVPDLVRAIYPDESYYNLRELAVLRRAFQGVDPKSVPVLIHRCLDRLEKRGLVQSKLMTSKQGRVRWFEVKTAPESKHNSITRINGRDRAAKHLYAQ